MLKFLYAWRVFLVLVLLSNVASGVWAAHEGSWSALLSIGGVALMAWTLVENGHQIRRAKAQQ